MSYPLLCILPYKTSFFSVCYNVKTENGLKREGGFMQDIQKLFKGIKLDIYKPSARSYFDPVRKYFVPKTPEEEVRQKTILFLIEQLGVPCNRLRIEESMSHVKKRARGRADIVVYRDDEKNIPLLVVECKAPEVDISCDEVREQAERYRAILKADYIMLVNGCQLITYQYQDGKQFELVNISSYQDLLASNVSFVEELSLKVYTYEEVMSKELQDEFTGEYVGCETPKLIKSFAMNFLNLLLLKPISEKSILELLGVLEDRGTGRTRFGNSAGYNYQIKTRLFIAKDRKKKDQILGLSLFGGWNTQLNVSIMNRERRHHSLQLDMDKYCEYDTDTDTVVITHNGILSMGRGGSISKYKVIEYVKEHAPDLIRDDEVYLGCIDNSHLLEWNQPDVQSFIRNVFRYAILRDEIRGKKKRKKKKARKSLK